MLFGIDFYIILPYVAVATRKNSIKHISTKHSGELNATNDIWHINNKKK